MKNFTSYAIGFLLAAVFTGLTLTASAVEVTFRVDMSEQTVSPNGVHIAGSFQGWDPSASQMTDMGNGIYAITFTLNQGEHHNFKFLNGNDWPYAETVPAQCGEPDGYGGYNRYVDVPAQDTILTAICFGSCVECNPTTVDITFQVDMSNETVSPAGVHIAGSFQNWNPGSTEMLPAGSNVYTVTVPLAIGEYIEFKYINGIEWGQDESVPPACSNNNNRYLTVPSQDSTLQVVCFGSCEPCTIVTYVDITFRVDMSNETVSPNGVHIAGSFQGWDPGASQMTNMGNDVYELTFTLQSGQYHEYKFINGNQWGEDESIPWPCNSNDNRFIVVPDINTILPAVCFGSCNVCNPAQFDVTFSVDMSYETVSPEGVHIAGSFQGWDPAATLMTDMGNNIYEITLTLFENDYHEYKFVNGNDWSGAEIVPANCNAFGNRYLVVPSATTSLPVVCFASCDPCPAPTYKVSITVLLEGPFNGIDMNTSLNTSGYLPLSQPFNSVPWNYSGTETVAAIPGSDIVDWILIELRETAGNSSSANFSTMIDRQAAFLMKDGAVTSINGEPEMTFIGTITENLYVVVWTRNHLVILSEYSLQVVNDTYTYDFTTGSNQAFGGINAHKELAPGIWGMKGGDGNADKQVNNSDKVDVWMPTAGNSGYEPADFNMDGQVNNLDKVDVWLPNSGSGAQMPPD